MNVLRLLRQSVTVERTAATGDRDDFGDPAVVVDDPVTYRGYLWQTQTDEDTVDQAQVSETFRLALEAAAAGNIDASDRVTVDGRTYEVIGEPHRATNARTAVIEYVDCSVRRVR